MILLAWRLWAAVGLLAPRERRVLDFAREAAKEAEPDFSGLNEPRGVTRRARMLSGPDGKDLQRLSFGRDEVLEDHRVHRQELGMARQWSFERRKRLRQFRRRSPSLMFGALLREPSAERHSQSHRGGGDHVDRESREPCERKDRDHERSEAACATPSPSHASPALMSASR